MTAAIAWERVSVALGGEAVLRDVTLDVPAGAWLSLIGPNGAGKTTLVRTLGGAVPHHGAVRLLGRDAARLGARDRARELARRAPASRDPAGHADLRLRAARPRRRTRGCGARRRSRTAAGRSPCSSASGSRASPTAGWTRCRAASASGWCWPVPWCRTPPLLVLDEPTAALDVGHQLEVLELIADLRTERELTIVTTVHDLTVAGQFADVVAVMAGGRLAAHGTPSDVLTPEVIGAHWGVDATCDVDDDGSVTVTVRRRKEQRRRPAAASSPTPTPHASEDEPR